MQHFAFGFLIALLVAAALLLLLLRKGCPWFQNNRKEHSRQLKELSELTGELAHEIKNPLSTIKVNLKLISEELKRFNPGQQTEHSEQLLGRALRKRSVVQKETDRLEQILDGFLQYVDRPELHLVSSDINELASEMIDFYSPQAYSHSITIRQSLFTEPLVCKVDAGMLKQVILNLFINAQQAMEAGGELIIRTEKQDSNALIYISDTGSGIADDKLADIFSPYYSSRPKGSGLGLPTAKRIAESHNGKLSVDSQLGKGTLFTIALPLAQCS